MRARTCVSVVVFIARKLRPCPSYSRRRDRNNSVHWRSLYKGGAGYQWWSWLLKGAVAGTLPTGPWTGGGTRVRNPDDDDAIPWHILLEPRIVEGPFMYSTGASRTRVEPSTVTIPVSEVPLTTRGESPHRAKRCPPPPGGKGPK